MSPDRRRIPVGLGFRLATSLTAWIQLPAIPNTKTGKELEVPIKRLLQGAALEDAGELGAVDSPDLVRHYVELISCLRQREPNNPERKEQS